MIEVPPTGHLLFGEMMKIPEELLAQIAAEARRAIRTGKMTSYTNTNASRRQRRRVGSFRQRYALCRYTPSKLFISSSVRKPPAGSWTNTTKSSELASLGILREWDTFVVQALKEGALFDEGEVRHQTQANCAAISVCIYGHSAKPQD